VFMEGTPLHTVGRLARTNRSNLEPQAMAGVTMCIIIRLSFKSGFNRRTRRPGSDGGAEEWESRDGSDSRCPRRGIAGAHTRA